MNQLTEYRREFHKYPENGWREFRTSARVAEILTGMGYDVAMGPDVIEPGSVGEPERLSEEQIRQEMGRAVRQGADPAFVERTQGWPGVMAVLDTGREGPVSAMRFEMDCLPYDEPQRPGYRPCDEGYLSCNPQSVHACGHDGVYRARILSNPYRTLGEALRAQAGSPLQMSGRDCGQGDYLYQAPGWAASLV